GAIGLPEVVVGANDSGSNNNNELDELLYVQLAGDMPTGDAPPEFPEKRPGRLSELKRIARTATRYYRVLELVIDAVPYLEERRAEIRASLWSLSPRGPFLKACAAFTALSVLMPVWLFVGSTTAVTSRHSRAALLHRALLHRMTTTRVLRGFFVA
ncbi:MAG TPA: hypothetical protein VNQ56_10285, partial [Pseudolabrys sp.]|nr:hypothetical protein [Pseudolabrys sp.]